MQRVGGDSTTSSAPADVVARYRAQAMRVQYLGPRLVRDRFFDPSLVPFSRRLERCVIDAVALLK
jgi:hypothetical protein